MVATDGAGIGGHAAVDDRHSDSDASREAGGEPRLAGPGRSDDEQRRHLERHAGVERQARGPQHDVHGILPVRGIGRELLEAADHIVVGDDVPSVQPLRPV